MVPTITITVRHRSGRTIDFENVIGLERTSSNELKMTYQTRDYFIGRSIQERYLDEAQYTIEKITV